MERRSMFDWERLFIIKTLKANGWVVNAAALEIGVRGSTLLTWIEKYGLTNLPLIIK